MLKAFLRANAPLQFALVFITMAIVTVLYAGNWIPYAPKTILYAAITGIIMFFASNAARASYEKVNYYPRQKDQRIIVALLAITFTIAALVKHYELTQ